jgi:hypothetical protein
MSSASLFIMLNKAETIVFGTVTAAYELIGMNQSACESMTELRYALTLSPWFDA